MSSVRSALLRFAMTRIEVSLSMFIASGGRALDDTPCSRIRAECKMRANAYGDSEDTYG